MKILRCIHSANPEGGGPIANIRGMQPALEARGHEVELATLDAPDAPFLARYPTTVTALGPGTPGFGYSRRWAEWMRRNLSRFDAVIIHGIWQYPSRSVPLMARAQGIPYFIYPHGMLDPWFNRAYPWKRWKKQAYWLVSEHRNLSRANAVFFTSEEERVRARNSFYPYRLHEEVVVYGIPEPPVQVPDTPHPANGRPYLLFLGRLHEKKGIALLLEAYRNWAGNRSIDLVLAGPDQAPHLTRKLREHPEENIHLPGMLEGAAKWNALRRAEAFILPSHQENFGIAVAEALACGTPVLISNQVNIWKEITGAGAGMVEPDTSAGVLNLLRRWEALPSDEVRVMKKSARALFQDKFEVRRAAEDLEKKIMHTGTP